MWRLAFFARVFSLLPPDQSGHKVVGTKEKKQPNMEDRMLVKN